MVRTVLFLTGPKGVGKTTLGKQLAQDWNWIFFDTDELFFKLWNISPRECLKNEGEDAFFEKEFQVVCNLETFLQQNNKNIIVATGGRTLLFEKSYKKILNLGQVILLLMDKEKLLKRWNEKNLWPPYAPEDFSKRQNWFLEHMNMREMQYKKISLIEWNILEI